MLADAGVSLSLENEEELRSLFLVFLVLLILLFFVFEFLSLLRFLVSLSLELSVEELSLEENG